jgi:hypothetical protein
MPYTLWSHGQLLGESDFELARGPGKRRAGTFRPSPLGATLLPTLCGMAPALFAFGRMLERENHAIRSFEEEDPGVLEAIVTSTPEGREMMGFAKQLCELDLELRDPDGRIIETESLAVNDFELFREFARQEADAERGDGEESSAATPRPEPTSEATSDVPADAPSDGPRYVMSATLRRRRWGPTGLRGRFRIH